MNLFSAYFEVADPAGSSAPAAGSAASKRQRRPDGLFTHHGAWGPGVRLFRKLAFAGKAGVISCIVLLVVAQLMYVFVRNSGEAMRASEQELVGMPQVERLMLLLGHAQTLRGHVLAAGGKVSPAVTAALAEVDRDLAQLDPLMAGDATLLEGIQFVREAFLPLRTPTDDKEEGFKQADGAVQQVIRFFSTVADVSTLSLDPDADTYHLMLASTHQAPQAIRLIGRMRDLGTETLKNTALTPLEARALQGDSWVMYQLLEDLFARYERVVKANPGVAAALVFEDAFKPANTFLRATRKGPLAEGGVRGDAAEYASAGQAAIDSLVALSARSHTLLTGLIEARLARLHAARVTQLGIASLGLAVAAYFFYCFFLVTRGGMREVTHHIDAMAQGDLSTSPNPLGHDEAAALMLSISDMQASLRGLVGQVRTCADGIATASAQVSAGAHDLSDRTEKASSNLQQTASAMEQIATTVQHTAQRVDESAALGQENARVAGQGGQVIGQVVSTMQSIQASSQKIGDIVGVIDSIAFQTNILALNAAVEAARAGEQGRGFAVVASEVRALAQRSATAAKQIKDLITVGAEQTRQGTRVVQSAGDTMGQLVRNAQTMSGLLADMSTAAAEQTRGVTEVNASVIQLDHDTQRNAALVEQTSAAAASMNQMATELVAAAGRFRLPAT